MIPNGLQEILRVYGDPRKPDGSLNRDWRKDNIVGLDFPFPMRYESEPGHYVTTRRCQIHCQAVVRLQRALLDVWTHARTHIKKRDGYEHTTAYYDEKALAWLAEQGLDIWGGSFVYRRQRGSSSRISTHAFGIAVDINPGANAVGTKGNMPTWYIECFTRAGWVWGGKFKRRDPMHFQLAEGY